jgi:small-conductance mechanosensitive channel
VFRERPLGLATTSRRMLLYRFGHMIFPLLAIIMLRISIDVFPLAGDVSWLLETAVKIALIILYISFVKGFVLDRLVAKLMLYTGVFLLVLNALDILDEIASVLDVMALQLGNIRISMLGILRVTIFGSFIFWLGRISSNTGQEMIRKQEGLDFRTREVAAKLFDIVIFTVVFILLLQVMGINLTALAVFGGAVGVGLGFGLQSIASNFISGIIILLDRSLSIGDYVELEDGRAGHVTSLNMRSTTLETFDGKDIMVPNERFISSTFINWTHKNKKQRYRVDFSVAYDSDIRRLVDIVKVAVAKHPQVLSGPAYPFEEQPDCEIDGFGDSGVNMFVEFWMEAIDDGKNRVGGDLMLIIFEAMRDNGFTIPFPQREVRML